MVRALTFIEPFGSLVALGKKKIELRNWNTRFRGTFLIHTSRTLPNEIDLELLIIPIQRGVIIGKVDLIDVKNYSSYSEYLKDCDLHLTHRYFEEKDFPNRAHGFILENPVKFAYAMPAKGKLNFWEYSGPLEFAVTVAEGSLK